MRTLCIALLLIGVPSLGWAQASGGQDAPPPAAVPPEGPPTEPPPPPPPQGTQQPPPTSQPAPPQPAPAGPDAYQAQPAPPVSPQPAPAGQWVYTNQYGWLWIPHARQYTYIPPDAQVFPDQYVYYPAYGWRWVVAPWVYGYGPAPYWGAPGPRYFAWYSRPWFRVGGYWGWGAYRGWGPYRGWIGPRAWGPHGWAGAPAYYRSGVGGPHPAHAFKPAPPHSEQKRARRERREHER